MGNRIALLRQKKGLSQAALGRKLGLSASAIGMYEQGRREPSISILILLAKEFGVTIDDLLTGSVKKASVYSTGSESGTSKHEKALFFFSALWLIEDDGE